MRRLVTSALALAAALVLAASAQAADITVTTTADTIVADGQCSLREAVFATRAGAAVFGCAGGSGGVDTILLGPGTFDLEPGAGGTEDGNESGDIDSGPLNAFRVVGRGAGITVIDALRGDRAFDVFPNSSVSLEAVTVTRGRAGPGGVGGAVRNQGTLTVLRASLEDSAAGSQTEPLDFGGGGGAIWSGGPANPSVLIADTVFRGNAAGSGGDGRVEGPNATSGGGGGGAGGAIALESGSAELSATTFVGNRAGDGGRGAISSGGGASAEGPGGDGGGIAVIGPASASVLNSTFSGNLAGGTGETPFPATNRRGGEGGAAAVTDPGGSLRITWSTFAGNALSAQARATGARSVSRGQVSASIVADAAPACSLSAPAVLSNVVLPGDRSCAGPQIEGDARLGPLGANGGATPTLLPGAGSAAIDALVGVPCPGSDQRGLPRPRLGGCDAGAVEVQPNEPGAVGRPGGPPAPAVGRTSPRAARSISGLRLSPSTFRAAGSGGSIGKAAKQLQQRAPIGTTVRYRLDAAARVTFTIRKPVAGRKKGRRCVAPAKAPRGAKACVRQQLLKGSFAHQGAAGQNAFRFTGRLRRKALAPGPYTLVARLPRPATGRGALAAKAFRIVR